MKADEETQPTVPKHIEDLVEQLNAMQVDELTPRQALDALYGLKTTLEGGP